MPDAWPEGTDPGPSGADAGPPDTDARPPGIEGRRDTDARPPDTDARPSGTDTGSPRRDPWPPHSDASASPANPNGRPAATAPPLPAALCVLGMGLIGGSLMRAAARHVPVFGWSPGEATRQSAADDGHQVHETIEDALRQAAETDALVVLAAPVTAFPTLLRAVDAATPTALLTDVAGVKAPVADQVAELAPKARYIGSHPMTGTAHSGWAAGSPALFADHTWVTTLEETSRVEDWAQVAGLALAVGSRVVPAEPEAHDDAAARISHLPHLLALALAQVGQAGGALALSLAAGSFADATRVAGTRPELIRAMCEGNAEHLVPALDEALGQLGVARASLASTGSLAKITAAGHAARLAFDDRLAGLEPITLSGDEMVEQLLSVGAAGGYVTAIEPGPAPDAPIVRAMYPTAD